MYRLPKKYSGLRLKTLDELYDLESMWNMWEYREKPWTCTVQEHIKNIIKEKENYDK
jgi:hypothetical protein